MDRNSPVSPRTASSANKPRPSVAVCADGCGCAVQEFYVEKTEDGIKAAHEFVHYTLGKMVTAESQGNLTDNESPDASDKEDAEPAR